MQGASSARGREEQPSFWMHTIDAATITVAVATVSLLQFLQSFKARQNFWCSQGHLS